MSSISRSIRRNILFNRMNKQQKLMWKASHGGMRNPNKQNRGTAMLEALRKSKDKEADTD